MCSKEILYKNSIITKFFTIIGLRKIISLCRNLKISARLDG